MLSCGPHQSTIGNAQSRHVLTDVRSACGHWSTGPSGVWAQSRARIRRAISLWPWNGLCATDEPEREGAIVQYSDAGVDAHLMPALPGATLLSLEARQLEIPKSRIAFSLKMSGFTSSLMAIFSRSAIQRSGVRRG